MTDTKNSLHEFVGSNPTVQLHGHGGMVDATDLKSVIQQGSPVRFRSNTW